MPSEATTPRALLTPAALHILLALAEEELHGYAIRADVEERTGGELVLQPGTLYEALHRMVKSGWIRIADESEPRRKTYAITDAGRGELQAELARLDEIVRYARDRDILPHRDATT